MTAPLGESIVNCPSNASRVSAGEVAGAPPGPVFQRLVEGFAPSSSIAPAQRLEAPTESDGVKPWTINIAPNILAQVDARMMLAEDAPAKTREQDDVSREGSTSDPGGSSVLKTDMAASLPPPAYSQSSNTDFLGGPVQYTPGDGGSALRGPASTDEKVRTSAVERVVARAPERVDLYDIGEKSWKSIVLGTLPADRGQPCSPSISADAPLRRDGAGTAGAAPAPIARDGGATLKIHVAELSTHFPAAIASLLPAPAHDAAGASQITRPEAPPETPRPSAPEPRYDLVKVLRFELEPATLGALSVKMRLSHSRVEIEIDTRSVATSSLLAQARDALSAAIEHKGLTLHAFDVTTQATTTDTGSQPDERNDRGGGGSGLFHEERSHRDERREGTARRHPEPAETDATFLAGVLL